MSDIRVRVKDKDYEWNMIMNDSNDDNTCKKIKSKNKNDESENGTYEYSSSISTSTTTMIPTLKMFWRGNKTTSKLKSAYKLISQRWKCECLHHTIKLLKGETNREQNKEFLISRPWNRRKRWKSRTHEIQLTNKQFKSFCCVWLNECFRIIQVHLMCSFDRLNVPSHQLE